MSQPAVAASASVQTDHMAYDMQEGSDFKKQESKSIAALSIITAFVRYGKEDVLGRSPDIHGGLAAPVQDLEPLTGSENTDVSQASSKLQGVITRLESYYSNR